MNKRVIALIINDFYPKATINVKRKSYSSLPEALLSCSCEILHDLWKNAHNFQTA